MAGRKVSAYAARYLQTRVPNYFTATIRVLRMSEPVFDEDSGIVANAYDQDIYVGPARVWGISPGGVLTMGDDTVVTRQTYISIPWDSDPVPRRDDLVIVDSYGMDTDVLGDSWRVTDVDGGGLVRASRRMTCVSWYPDRNWGE